MHPDWEYRFWTDDNLEEIDFYKKHKKQIDSIAIINRADILRLAVLDQFGGVYCDTDIESIKPFDCLMGNALFAGKETSSYPTLAIGVIGAVKGHPYTKEALRKISEEECKGWYSLKFFTEMFSGPEMTVLGSRVFYPYYCMCDVPDSYPAETICSHHWNATWTGGKDYIKKGKENIDKVLEKYPDLVKACKPD